MRASCCLSLKKPKDADKEEAKDTKAQRLVSKLGVGPFWVPLYGAPLGSRVLTQVVGEGFDKHRDEMNHHPEMASAYRCEHVLAVAVTVETDRGTVALTLSVVVARCWVGCVCVYLCMRVCCMPLFVCVCVRR